MAENLNCPQTTAAGRLFDAAAVWLQILQVASFEGQGAAYLEALCQSEHTDYCELSVSRNQLNLWEINWENLLKVLLNPELSIHHRASLFHQFGTCDGFQCYRSKQSFQFNKWVCVAEGSISKPLFDGNLQYNCLNKAGKKFISCNNYPVMMRVSVLDRLLNMLHLSQMVSHQVFNYFKYTKTG
ncbi:MAG: hypothetical protein R3E08_01240 [Thiotrichaceae bacterium]